MKDYCNITFGKSLDSLKYEDIILFFQEERVESNILEFKSGQSDVKKFDDMLNKKIIRTIASFLNSEGGLLIWGSPREQYVNKAGKNVKIAIGDLEPNLVFNEKDQLINKIIKTISYMPTGVRLKTLRNGDEYIYIFEVDESASRPHQYQNEYLIRIDGQTFPAPHYLVDAMFKQIKHPNIENHIKIVDVYQKATGLFIKLELKLFNFTSSIPGKEISFYARTTVGIFKENDSDFIQSQPNKLLFFGLNPSTFLTLHITTSLLMEGLENLDIIIYMTGENILTKTSQHEIILSDGYEFDKIQLLPLIENLEVHKADNNLMNDRESILKEFLMKN